VSLYSLLYSFTYFSLKWCSICEDSIIFCSILIFIVSILP
jgi:hypothetical protein